MSRGYANPYGMPGAALMSPAGMGQGAPMQLPKEIIRIGEQAIWSAQRYAAATALANTSARVFTTPRGQTGQGFGGSLTIAETNLKEGGRIPGGYSFDVDAIAVQPYTLSGTTAGSIFPLVGQDMRNLLANCILQWDFIQSIIDVAPVALIGQGGGVFGATADTGAAAGPGGTQTLLNNGNGQLWLYRDTPVSLPSNSTFATLLTWGGSAVAVNGGPDACPLILRVHLLGRYKTAIEIA